ncbi:hypothetical protein F8388_026414 [Cannabis sativa]|uniref:Uncharacterized protein n=1 Tax=Cannabis sativa TaxID=3483 RepID=A0A7J6ETF8_CANSA|nr:hypothetical protein F8388_026414 [Cannabis sativa]
MEVRAWCTADLLKVVSSKRLFSWWSEEAEMDGGKEVGCGSCACKKTIIGLVTAVEQRLCHVRRWHRRNSRNIEDDILVFEALLGISVKGGQIKKGN